MFVCVYPVVVSSQELGKFTIAGTPSWRAVSCWLLGEFCGGSDPEVYGEYVPMVVKDLINRLHDEDVVTVSVAVGALDRVVASFTAEGMVEHLDFIRSLLRSTVSDAKHRKGAVQGSEFALKGVPMCVPMCVPVSPPPFVAWFARRFPAPERPGPVCRCVPARVNERQ